MPSDIRLFINFAEADRAIGEDFIRNLTYVSALDPKNIKSSGDLLGGDEVDVLLKEADAAGAIVHLLSVNFKNGNTYLIFKKERSKEQLVLPVLVGFFPYQYEQDIMAYEDLLIPTEESEIEKFTNNRQAAITKVIERLCELLQIQSQPRKAKRLRSMLLVLCYAVLIGGALLTVMEFQEPDNSVTTWICGAGTLLLAAFIAILLRFPVELDLVKSKFLQ